MKVKDLIEILMKMNPESEIIPEPTEEMRLKKTYNYSDDEGWVEEKKEP